MNETRFLWVCALTVAALLGATVIPRVVMGDGGGALDGKTYTVKAATLPDELRFADGKFYSDACKEWGFGWGAYWTTENGAATTFEAKTSSPKHGDMVWTGTVKGGEVEGRYVWTKKGWFRTKTETKEFRGTLKQ